MTHKEKFKAAYTRYRTMANLDMNSDNGIYSQDIPDNIIWYNTPSPDIIKAVDIAVRRTPDPCQRILLRRVEARNITLRNIQKVDLQLIAEMRSMMVAYQQYAYNPNQYRKAKSCK